MGQRNFKKPFEFYNFSEIFYCGMTRLRNTKLSVFKQCEYIRTILRNKNMDQSLFKKHSKYLIFNKFFTVIWANAGTNSRNFLENIFTQKLLQNMINYKIQNYDTK